MKYPDFTRELQVPTSCPLLGVTPFRIVAVHHWKYKNIPYSNFIQDPDIVDSRQPTRIQILRSNRSLPLPPLSQFQHSVLVACNLGDLHIRKNICSTTPDTFSIEFKQGWKNEVYMNHLLTLFSDYHSSAEAVLRPNGRRKGRPDLPASFWFQTVTGYIWEWYHEQSYVLEITARNKVGNGEIRLDNIETPCVITELNKHWSWEPKDNLKKTIPLNLDVYFADADIDVVLAYLYMDDGFYQQKKTSLEYGASCDFALNDYPRLCVVRLSEYLNNRFGWNTSVRKKLTKNPAGNLGKKTSLSWQIYIPVENRQDFFSRIYPHVIPHFFYKLPVQFRTYTVKHPDGTKEVKFWPQINKNLPPKVHVRKDRKQWQNSRKELRDWVLKKCESLTTPENKLSSLQIWKKLNSKPRSPYWSPVAFELNGQWYSVDVTKARNLIKDEKGE